MKTSHNISTGGEQYVTFSGPFMMLWLCAANWAMTVCYSSLCVCLWTTVFVFLDSTTESFHNFKHWCIIINVSIIFLMYYIHEF